VVTTPTAPPAGPFTRQSPGPAFRQPYDENFL